MRKTYLIWCLLLTTIPVFSQVYYLPKTVLRLHLQMERQSYTPGAFSRYADRYLGLSGINQEQQMVYRVMGCELTSIGVRDTTKCFTLHLKGKGEEADIRLSDDGVLQAINAEPVSQQIPFPMASSGTASRQSPRIALLPAEVQTAGSMAKKAELTARLINELRQQRQQLATGEADDMPQDELQLQLMLNELDQQCNDLLQHFTGTTFRDTLRHTLTFCPEQDVNREVLFRVSHYLGLVDKDDLAGVPFYITIKNLYPSEVPLPENDKGEDIYANVPGMAQVTIEQEDQPLASFTIPVAQFGYLELRKGSIFKKQVSHMTFHPATGAVVHQSTDEKE
ncbi:MAG: DUF4831 family protein [Prevotella sp.]|nr:DUF4831 family protein [Prevotella sp.]